jgi:hypothetical protein
MVYWPSILHFVSRNNYPALLRRRRSAQRRAAGNRHECILLSRG